MIYLRLKGRIGNQLFMYAACRAIQIEKGENELIVIDDSINQQEQYQYLNCLQYYHLNNVVFDSSQKLWKGKEFRKQRLIVLALYKITSGLKNRARYNIQVGLKRLLFSQGIFLCDDGYMKYPRKWKKNMYVEGYFQSERYFEKYKNIILNELNLDNELTESNYPNLDQIRNRNTVCISIKVQHNVGNPAFDVCSEGYWEKAINYIIENVENPLFFICSDNVEYVKENLIDCTKYDVIEQPKDVPVHLSLAAMSKCKHFIIGNTSFGWWAQYMCTDENKIVVAPSRWYGTDVPCEIYQDNWKLIEV